MRFQSEVKVRFGETDLLCHVNNTSFFTYIEVARIDFLGHIGASKTMKDWRYVVAHVACDFIGQAYLNEELIITTVVSHIGTKSFTLLHDIIRKADGKRLAKGKAVLIYFNFDTQKSEPVPDSVRKQLELYNLDGGEEHE